MRERRDRRGLHGARPLLQVARHHRQDARGAGSAGRRLRPLAGPGAEAAVHEEPLPLQLALVLGYGNGDIGNQGIHEIDMARWGLGVTHPTKVTAIGGKFMFDDDQETPNTISAAYEFDVDGKKKMMTFEVAALDLAARSRHRRKGSPATRSATCSTARRATWSSTTTTSTTRSSARIRSRDRRRPQRDEHWANFMDAVRSRKREDLNAEIEEGALSCNLVHLANISYRLGRTLHWDAKKMECIGDDEANKMLTREYRAPFVVPAQV